MTFPIDRQFFKMDFLYLLALLVLAAQVLFISAITESDECHNMSENAHLFMATKTAYSYVANKNDSPVTYPGCEPVKFWAMIRHGTRYPSSKVIARMNERLPLYREKILNNFKEGQGRLCETEIEKLSKWKPHVDEVDEKRLTYEGEDELLELGERFQKRFPGLLTETYSNSSYKFQFTATQRTKESARHFAMGLFGRKVTRHVWFPEAIYRDPVLRFYKSCERWRKGVDKNPDSLVERRIFEEGPEMTAARQRISKVLGQKDLITVDDAHLIYTTCKFETAWNPTKLSPWCALFSDEDFKVFEYGEDLEYYWVDGYGFEINYKQACPTIKDMFSFFRQASSEPTAVLYFSHSGTMLKMIAHLGIHRDEEPLRAGNFADMVENRQWRVGRIGSFATNIAFVLHRCGTDFKILTLHQERPVRLPGCPPTEDLCPIDIFQEAFLTSNEKCDFQDMCKWDGPATASSQAKNWSRRKEL